MKLSDLKDANGNSIQSFAEVLKEKCQEHGVGFVFIFMQKPSGIHAITSIDGALLPGALKALAHQMRKEPKSVATLADGSDA